MNRRLITYNYLKTIANGSIHFHAFSISISRVRVLIMTENQVIFSHYFFYDVH